VCQNAVLERAEAKGRNIKRLQGIFKARMTRCPDNRDWEEILFWLMFEFCFVPLDV
jgi:hypothetical protein